MEWTADVAAGDWLRGLLDDPWRGTVHDVIPRGFAAYARVLHPAWRDRPVGVPWPPLPYAAHAREWEAFQASRPEIDVERTTWARAAAAFGTTLHPEAQWHRLVGPGIVVPHEDGPRDAEGWRYSDPGVGQLDADVLAALAEVLAAHTGTPDAGRLAVWEGWGGLVGGMGYGPSRVLFTIGDEQGEDPRHGAFLRSAARDALNDVFRQPTWQPGALPDDVSRGPRLRLPARDHVLFRAGASELADPEWPSRAPWHDLDAPGMATESPSLLWPDDHAWVLATDVDLDSTIVGGSAVLVDALCADPRFEALPLRAGAYLTSEGDRLNP